MNLLFDFITAVNPYGSGVYARVVLCAVLARIEKLKLPVRVYALYDSSSDFASDDLREEFLSANHNISYVDCADKSIADIVVEKGIDRFFIACSQPFSNRRELEEIKCEVIAVIHDFWGEDHWQDKLEIYMDMIAPGADEPAKLKRLGPIRRLPFLRRKLDMIDRFSLSYIASGGNDAYLGNKRLNEPVFRMVKENPGVKLITVSEASRYSFLYHYGDCGRDIEVLYPPERETVAAEHAQCPELADLLSSGKKYYLMVSADRRLKNPYKMLHAFERFSAIKPDAYIVTLGCGKTFFGNHIDLPFLSDGDLSLVLDHSYALVYPSFYEGFGYPPLEAMHRGKPVLCSNVTSMPEIFGDAPIWFTPFYEASIFSALMKLTDDNHETYARRSLARYEAVHARQQSDLERLVDIILSLGK